MRGLQWLTFPHADMQVVTHPTIDGVETGQLTLWSPAVVGSHMATHIAVRVAGHMRYGGVGRPPIYEPVTFLVGEVIDVAGDRLLIDVVLDFGARQ